MFNLTDEQKQRITHLHQEILTHEENNNRLDEQRKKGLFERGQLEEFDLTSYHIEQVMLGIAGIVVEAIREGGRE